jgi:hypothetical protein
MIGGFIVLMMINFNIFQNNTMFTSDSELQLQQNAKTLAEILNNDLRKIGFRHSGTAFITADSERVSFYSDIDYDGTVDRVTYYLGDTTSASLTTNPRDRVLYRIINNDTIQGPSLGLIKAKFSYLNGLGATTSNLSEMKYIRAELWIEPYEPNDGEYPFTYWELTINPRNL